MRLEDMINIGEKLAYDLRKVGIETPEDLRAIGSIEAIKKLGLSGPTCSNKLYALEGAILDIRWHGLDKNHKDALYKRMKNEINLRN